MFLVFKGCLFSFCCMPIFSYNVFVCANGYVCNLYSLSVSFQVRHCPKAFIKFRQDLSEVLLHSLRASVPRKSFFSTEYIFFYSKMLDHGDVIVI